MPSLDWIGKNVSELACQRTPICALEPRDPKNPGSIIEDNLLIHGDNLFALRALLPYYRNLVKLAYLDPPYNTGNQLWIYNDAMNAEETAAWIDKTVGPEDLSRSDKWLCMMQPRLEAVYELLAESGVLACSIDDAELQNLLALLDAQFGRDNRIAIITVVNNPSGRSDAKHVATSHEYLVLYSKNISELESNLLPLSDEDRRRYNKKDSKGLYQEVSLQKTGSNSKRKDRPNMFYTIYRSKKGVLSLDKGAEGDIAITPKLADGSDGRWRWGKEKFKASNKDDLTSKKINGIWRIYVKQRIKDSSGEERGVKPKSFWNKPEYSTTTSSNEIKSIFGEIVFETPKSLRMIEDLVSIFSNPGDLVLDPFAGSGTTAHAVLRLNSENPTEEPRRFIAVEMEEEVEKEVTSVRLDRVIKGYKTPKGKKAPGLGGDYSRWVLGEEIRQADGSLGGASYLALSQVLAAYHNLTLRGAGGPLIAEDDSAALFFYHAQAGDNFGAKELGQVEKLANGRKAIVYAHNSFVDDERAAERGVEVQVIPYDFPVQPIS